MKETWILGIQITDRVKEASRVQDIMTKFGCTIKTRLGLHEVTENFCSQNGLILLELTGNPVEFPKLENALLAIPGLQVKKMIFQE
ncbi:MAG: hypothetical protein PHP04_11630 [Bacteroidales bacterium]|nr:hypothetical protein [Bacteroidales bacterium]HNW74536.1 hypothetical protein [Bacteroidales bacterium]HPS50734.1 hypothetical protein [Bacteroidales bacterium]